MKKVVLLCGGQSLEHDVSLASAKSILEHVDSKKWKMIPIVIDQDGKWYFYE